MRGGKKGKRQNTSASLQTCTDTGVLRPSTPPLTPPSSPLPPVGLVCNRIDAFTHRTTSKLSCLFYFLPLSFSSKTLQGEKQACTHQGLAIYRLGCFLSMGGGGGATRRLARKTPFVTPGVPPLKFRPASLRLSQLPAQGRRSRSSPVACRCCTPAPSPS